MAGIALQQPRGHTDRCIAQVGRSAAWACLLAWPLGTLALSCWPVIGYYSGMSGLLMAMLAVLAVSASAQPDTRGIGMFLLIVLVNPAQVRAFANALGKRILPVAIERG